jgi:hypothetical protein
MRHRSGCGTASNDEYFSSEVWHVQVPSLVNKHITGSEFGFWKIKTSTIG